jgi:hypothetical protein
MFSVITNVHNKKTKGPTLIELFTDTGKLKTFVFRQLEVLDVFTKGHTAHIDMIFKFLPQTLQWSVPKGIAALKNIDAPILTRVWQELEYRIDVCRVTRGAHIEHL